MLENEVAIPAYYNGTPVTQTMLEGPETGIWVSNIPKWAPSFYGAEKIFTPYNEGFDDDNWPARFRFVKELFATTTSRISLSEINRWENFGNAESIFLVNIAFCSLMEQMENNEFYTLNITNDYTFSVSFNTYIGNPIYPNFIIQRANTTYCFNYEGSPNEDIFFINDFERGGKIENTPYEPLRDGYTFAGWYKEPECISAWDFEKDTLSAPEYYENGELKYIETKLYAKWINN